MSDKRLLINILGHGGKREGAGRKHQADGHGKSIPKSIKVSQDVADYLAAIGTGVIEDMIRASEAYARWTSTKV